MKHTLIEINELSDSKEVYGQRPNPFISAFIYSILAILLIAVLYSCLGKIEIVSTASGVVRPNDDVSTVSSLLSGQITGVYYTEGQVVQKGDPLFTVDTSEFQISLNSLTATKEEYEEKVDLIKKFLDGIEAEKNPFSSDEKSDEYPYYIQFRNYELTKKNTQEKFDYDAGSASANVSSLKQNIADIEKQIAGLNAYKSSIQSESNQAASYPEYEHLYLLYKVEVDTMDAEYKSQRQQIELDQTSNSNQYYMDYYGELVTDYELLLKSIEKGESMFSIGCDSFCSLLWNDYIANLEEYERNYDVALAAYELCLNNGDASAYSDNLLGYDRAMLEGYQYFRQSVENDTDMFPDEQNSAYYRNLYNEYRAQYNILLQSHANSAVDAYKADTLKNINNTILQIQASLAEKELSINSASSVNNITTTKIQLESAEAAISSYKNQKTAEYKNMLADYRTKLQEVQFSEAASYYKASLLADLDNSHNNSLEKKCLQTITQIDSSIQALKAELASAQTNLKLYQIADSMYQSNVDENGVPVSISMAKIEQISSLQTQQENLSYQINELNTQIQQTKEKLSYGTIIAEQSGIVSVISTLVIGDSISAGTQIATIIPSSESQLKVQLYVNNSDIADISVGDDVRYNLSALPSNQYGIVNGKVTRISTDTLVQNGQYSGYYLVECSIDNTTLTDKDGNYGSVVIGMQVEAKIVTQSKTIIRYLLEKINLF